LPFQRMIELLGDLGVRDRDNPHVPDGDGDWIADDMRQRIRAWEEAPLLDEIALTAGYRATLVNLGLLEVSYSQLGEFIDSQGVSLAKRLRITPEQLAWISRCLLDEMRRMAAVSREMLRYHVNHAACPAYVKAADWERRVKEPKGFAADTSGRAIPYLDSAAVPSGVSVRNPWRRPAGAGRAPGLERIFKELLSRFGGVQGDARDIVDVLELLRRGQFIVAAELYGYRDHCRLLQVNAERITFSPTTSTTRMHCEVCGTALAGAKRNLPCPRCHGVLIPWTDDQIEENRTVRRIKAGSIVPLNAGEHTAQVTNDDRLDLERKFKAPAAEEKLNLLACSPTLEMGIDVGGLEAVVLRNIPPRPDNYAQRGGRAGRRHRIGMVVGYARATPHDEYFYDHPEQMISGEVPAPVVALANHDVLLRHIQAIAFGSAEPGLAGRMLEYIGPTGDIKQDKVDELITAVAAQADFAIDLALEAFGTEILRDAQLDRDSLTTELAHVRERVQDVMDRTARQVRQLRQALEAYASDLTGAGAAVRSAQLVARLLGIPAERARGGSEADDRSAGYPLRRFAEFGLLPGYEFPTNPASVRLLGDLHEEDPVSVARRFGIAQFQPNAQVYARTKRWKVSGLDTASPWNPQIDGPTWLYRVCRECGLRYTADAPSCPRCQSSHPGQAIPAAEYAGFLATRDDNTILDEEDRFATRNLVKAFPQWNGTVSGRWVVGSDWRLRWSRREDIYWVNEGLTPSPEDLRNGVTILHNEAKGYLLCATCGRILSPGPPPAARGRRTPRSRSRQQDPYGHSGQCSQAGSPPEAIAISTSNAGEVLRLQIPISASVNEDLLRTRSLSLGYALLTGMRRVFMLDGSEIQFELEGPWRVDPADPNLNYIALSFVDPSIGGTGYLCRVAEQFHRVAAEAIEHLQHDGCTTACYRCLKAYDNQRFHEFLNWPLVMDSLEVLAARPAESVPLGAADIDDPRPWIEAYAAGVGSPLEHKFLKLFAEHGFHPATQVPVAPSQEERLISIADFAVPESRLAIYIDGAAFHAGDNLRRDRYIRNRLRNGTPPWTVEELRAGDLSSGRGLVERLREFVADQSRAFRQGLV
jgi:rubrerythrin